MAEERHLLKEIRCAHSGTEASLRERKFEDAEPKESGENLLAFGTVIERRACTPLVPNASFNHDSTWETWVEESE